MYWKIYHNLFSDTFRILHLHYCLSIFYFLLCSSFVALTTKACLNTQQSIPLVFQSFKKSTMGRRHPSDCLKRGPNPLGLYSSVLSKLMVKFWVMFCYSIYCKIYHNWFYDIFRLFWTRLADYGSSIENSFIGYAFMADLENIIWKSYFST